VLKLGGFFAGFVFRCGLYCGRWVVVRLGLVGFYSAFAKMVFVGEDSSLVGGGFGVGCGQTGCG